jgi:rhodanese-related sulfurtransferase
MAALAALISNALSSPSRRLAWLGRLAEPTPSATSTTRAAPPAPLPQPPVAAHPGPPAWPRPAPIAALPAPSPPPGKPQEAATASPIREISGEESWKAFQAGTPFLDARRSAEFAEGHIAGAWCTPAWESDLDDRLISFKAARRPGPDDPIVIYCSGGDCRDSHLLAAKLLKEGYGHLLIYRDGFPDWTAQKHPVEKGQP